MTKAFALGNAAADFAVAAVAVSGSGSGESVSLALLSTTSLLVGLWGLAAGLRSFCEHRLPPVVTIEDLAKGEPNRTRGPLFR